MLGQIIGGLGSILGGIMGGEEKSKTKSKTRTRSTSKTRTNLKMMVRQAERNGFNPLTVLQAGGMAAFSNTSSFSNSKMKGSGSSSSSSPLAAGIAGAASAIGGAIDNAPSNVAVNAASAWQGAGAAGQSANAAEYDALHSQLKAVQPGTLGTQPRVPVSAVETADVPALKAGTFPAEKAKYKGGEVPNPLGFEIPDTVRSTDDWSEILGEPGEYAGALDNALKIGAHHEWGVPQFKKDMTRFGTWGANKLQEAKERITAPIKESDYLPSAAKAAQKNIWDPPAIQMYLPPVVETKPQPDMYRDPFPAYTW